MEALYPVFTTRNDCQDCYKCLRACPVKAIRVEGGHAMVVPELCVACGTCVEVCPVGAKKIRDDRSRVRALLAEGRSVCVSLAPSWVADFPGLSPQKIVAALKALGFDRVSETALGAQEVSAALARRLAPAAPGLYLSTACPSAVAYVEKYLPRLASSLLPLPSPLLAHAALLKERYGEGTAVVFFGPCIAKKSEGDSHPELVEGVLTFDDLRRWLEEESISFDDLQPGPEDRFLPESSKEGALYPIEGGMNETIRAHGGLEGLRLFSITGLENMDRFLKGLRPEELPHPVFVECLACPGGCINGPCSDREEPALLHRSRVEAFAEMPPLPIRRPFWRIPELDYPPCAVESADISEREIAEALAQVGKFSSEDELNCGGCGYDSCCAFARALIMGRAEPTMCVSHMRKQAQKKANALLRCLPAGVVIVDAGLEIDECNRRFAELFGKETLLVYEIYPGLKGCQLAKVLPFSHLFRIALETGKDIHFDHLRHGDLLFDVTIFTIDPGQTVGAVILDVTRREIKRDQIAQRANEVIRKNLSTVQEIACRLGEHMAETEILLRSIAEGYGDEGGEDR